MSLPQRVMAKNHKVRTLAFTSFRLTPDSTPSSAFQMDRRLVSNCLKQWEQ